MDTLYPVHDLDPILKVYPDTNNDFSPERILSDTTLTFLKGDELPRLLNVGTTYWGKLNLKAEEKLIGWTLHFEDKMIDSPAWTKSNGTVDVYGYVDKELIFHQKTGAEYSKEEKAYKGNWIMNAITLDSLPVKKVVEIIIKVKGNAMGYPAYFNLTAEARINPITTSLINTIVVSIFFYLVLRSSYCYIIYCSISTYGNLFFFGSVFGWSSVR
ncbi:hypothetical protein NYZ99_02955 [Maribacter litopenaei]|uniref:Uncharacterized protein n=1 Tax=Maribacter litopenaei TaxID=2976127 RepID=A0ABY5Y9W5_9FLAO|nr:hypothetical protein [Maribacter litopenaei]UWX55494.1 hypothetical protein NYZ99_02955 [Maribacter litopenaei]